MLLSYDNLFNDLTKNYVKSYCTLNRMIKDECIVEYVSESNYVLKCLSKNFFLSSRRNVGYASTCNSVGQTAGFFLGFVIFIALESAEFCNNYLRSEPLPYGMVTLPGNLEMLLIYLFFKNLNGFLIINFLCVLLLKFFVLCFAVRLCRISDK